MNAIVTLMLLPVHVDGFYCSNLKLQQALPEFKQFISPNLFDKLQKVQWKNGDDLKNGNRRSDNKEIVKLILECLEGHQEKERCLAHLSIQYGYMSISDKHVSSFLMLDQKQVDQLRAVNRKCLATLRGLVAELSQTQYQKNYDIAYERYKAMPLEYYSILDAKQKNRFQLLYTEYNHKRDFKMLFTRLISEDARQRQEKEFYSRMEPNIQQHMLGGWLILLDSKEARNFLMISPEQDEIINKLYERYNASVSDLQALLSNDIKKDIDSAIRFYTQIAYKKSNEYEMMLSGILTEVQKQHLLGLAAQVHGVSICFSPTYAKMVGITTEQEKAVMKFTVDFIRQYNRTMNQEHDDSSHEYRQKLERALSNAFHDGLLTDVQRKKWKEIIGKPINEKALTSMQLEYLKRTANTLPAKKKE